MPSKSSTTLEQLTPLLAKFRLQARQFQAGPLCGAIRYSDRHGVAFLHVLREGRLIIRHPKREEGMPSELTIGEPTLIFYPRGTEHEFINPADVGNDFVCATVAFDGRDQHPLVNALPPLVMVSLRDFSVGDATLQMLFQEADKYGSPSVLADRLFEVLLLQLLRWMLPRRDLIPAGLLAGLAHSGVSIALAAIHNAPSKPWTVESLAGEARMSRSSFALDFRNTVGEAPMQYVARWRLTVAQQLLLQGRSLKVVAEEVGYGTSSALSRAFSASFGVSPRAWLQARSG